MNINGIIVLIGLFLVLIIGIIGTVLLIIQDDRKAIKKKEDASWLNTKKLTLVRKVKSIVRFTSS